MDDFHVPNLEAYCRRIGYLILSRSGLDGTRRNLLNLELTMRRPGVPATKLPIQSQEQLLEVLTQEFLIPAEAVPDSLFEVAKTF